MVLQWPVAYFLERSLVLGRFNEIDVLSAREMIPYYYSHRLRNSWFVNLPIVFLLLFLAMTPVTAAAQNRMSEALEVLKKFSGVWETRTRIRREGSPPSEFYTQGRASCRQALKYETEAPLGTQSVN
ncbi:MAG: hypothetical protein ACLPVO_13345 [Desulfomonilaceae bacterium]